MQVIDAQWETNLRAYFLSTEKPTRDKKLFHSLWDEPQPMGVKHTRLREKIVDTLHEAFWDPDNLHRGYSIADLTHQLSRWGADKNQLSNIMGRDPRFVQIGKMKRGVNLEKLNNTPVWGLLQNIEFTKMRDTLNCSNLFYRSDRGTWRLTEWTHPCTKIKSCRRWVNGSTHCRIHLDQPAESAGGLPADIASAISRL